MSEQDFILQHAVQARLHSLHLQLQVVQAGIGVAAAALRYQDAERDKDIANVLERCVGDRLTDQVERLADLIDSLRPLSAGPDDTDSWDPRLDLSNRIREVPRRAYWLPEPS